MIPEICTSSYFSGYSCKGREVRRASLYGVPAIGLCITYYRTMFDLPNIIIVALIDLHVHITAWSSLRVPHVEVADGTVKYC